MDGESMDIKQAGLQRLKEAFPEVFAENQLDWEKLKAAFGDDINFANERYVLNWAGKSDAFRVLQQPTTATLKPEPEESVNFDATENLFIEGENLEVLKVLQKAYYNKVKCIIIDPPYNTGSDSFIYPDRFSEKKEDYLKRIGDKDEEGFLMKEGLFRKNSKDSGHYHSNWLSMMYPRLFLAKNLLRDDGVIFVHIDDNEVHNLRMVMNEIFGEENILSELIWDLGTGTAAGHFTRAHEYILVYAKNKDSLSNFIYNGNGENNISERAVKKISKGNPASKITFPAGIEFEGTEAVFEKQLGKKEVVKIIDGEMIFKNGKLAAPVTLEAGWAMRNQILSWIEGKETYDSKGQKVIRFFFDKKGVLQYEKERGFVNPQTVLRNIASTRKGTIDVESLFGKSIMDFPKPVGLLKYLARLVTNSGELILDFFGGSGTTAQAVLELNKEDGGNRKFILVQMPEQCDENSEAYKAGYKTIADIGKERIRRVIQKIEKEIAAKEKPLLSVISALQRHSRENGNPENLFKDKELDSRLRTAGMTKEYSNDNKLDLGFKVFKLSPSSFKIWRSSEIDSAEKLVEQLDAFTDPIRPGAEKQNMLYELMLKAGRELTEPLQYVTVSKSGYYSINNNELIIALDAMNEKLIEQIIVAKPQKVITLDSLFTGNDQLKTNTVLQMRDAGVDFKTI